MILGLIPARGGSKGIPQKNIRPVCGKPLIAWTIEAALSAKRLDRVVVTTEDPLIAEISRNFGAEVLDRPPELATDEADTLSVMQHALREVTCDIVVLLQPTSPIRNDGLIDYCLDLFDYKRADSLATGFMCTYKPYGSNQARRQDIKGFFYDDGSIYINHAADVLRGDRFGNRMEKLCTDREQNIDVDEPFDLWLAEQVLRKRELENN